MNSFSSNPTVPLLPIEKFIFPSFYLKCDVRMNSSNTTSSNEQHERVPNLNSSISPTNSNGDDDLSEPFQLDVDVEALGEHEDWCPDKYTFMLAFLSISPSIIHICYKMKVASIPYLALLMSSVPLGLKLQDKNGYIRWITGFVCVAILSGIKSAVLMAVFRNDSISEKGLFYAYTALWECSNCVNILGGRQILEKHGINSYSKAILIASCPSQMKFINTQQAQGLFDKWKTNSLHLGAYAVALFVAPHLLKAIAEFTTTFAILEAEGIVIIISLLINIWNLPVHLYQMIMIRYPVQVIYPYGSIYVSRSSREFWSKWSRPASSMIRYMFYYPLGGSGRAWLSIPLMFLLNASSHYSVSESIVGDRKENGWNTVFGVLGIAATLEVFGNKYIPFSVDANGIGVYPSWWLWTRFALAAVSLRFAAYTLLHICFDASLADLL